MAQWLEALLSDFSVFDRRRSACLDGQQQLVHSMYDDDACDIGDILPLPTSAQSLHGANDHERSRNLSSIRDQMGGGWPNLGSTRHLTAGGEETSIEEQSNNSRKRKVESISNRQVGGAKDKRVKEGAERGGEGEEESRQGKKNKEASGGASKEDAKRPKTDCIHVRARRGQATDSHSLAERVRRERISERMKYLQDLVPGCNNVTGKAGILDRIINYVQSLQRQVEFLSMKLAAVNPTPDFNTDNFFNREMNLASSSGAMRMIDMSSEQALDPSYVQFSCLHPASTACSGLDMAMGSSDIVPHRTTSLPAPAPEAILDSSLHVHGSSSPWSTGLQNLYGVEFHQGRGPAFPFQLFLGDVLPHNLKMEM